MGQEEKVRKSQQRLQHLMASSGTADGPRAALDGMRGQASSLAQQPVTGCGMPTGGRVNKGTLHPAEGLEGDRLTAVGD